jgi:hypothetical protein
MAEFSWRGDPLAAVSAEVSDPDRSTDELLAGPRLRTRRTYAEAPVTSLVNAGFAVLATFLAPHVSIALPDYDETCVRTIRVTLPADVHQIDATGYVWTFLDEAEDPTRVALGTVIVAGDGDDPFLARVIDVVVGNSGREIVHLEVLGVPDQSSTNSATPTCSPPDAPLQTASRVRRGSCHRQVHG